MSSITPTRSAALELEEERRAMREGYRFLDEKRLLLAAEMLAALRQYEQAMQGFAESLAAARAALQAAVARHGLDGVQVYPAAHLEKFDLRTSSRQLLGVRLFDAVLHAVTAGTAIAEHVSPEAERCRERFAELIRLAAPLAALTGNLERLRYEYRRTERRARALEEVLIPEIDGVIADIEVRLEELDQEEAIRTRGLSAQPAGKI
jgi:V/A-type H+/Na+-transporting ATPase subunit D